MLIAVYTLNTSRKTYVVLGSNCFTGSHIVDRLLEDPRARVIGLSRSPEKSDFYLPYRRHASERFEFFQVDLVKQPERVMAILDEARPEGVINVAALSEVYQSHITPNEYFAVNTTAVVRLVNELRSRPWLERFVHVSSAEIYGNCDVPVTETSALNPSTPYAASKAAADLHLATVRKHFGFPVTIVRSTNVYGKHQQLYKIIPRAMIYLRLGKPIELHGGGATVRPFVHIRDVVDGISRILEHPSPSLVYHFSTDQTDCIAAIVGKISARFGSRLEDVTRMASDRAAQDARYWLDTSLARRELDWKPRVAFEEGLDEIKAWLESNWDQARKEPLEYIHLVEYSPRPASKPNRDSALSPRLP